jgi:hypothetical protein
MARHGERSVAAALIGLCFRARTLRGTVGNFAMAHKERFILGATMSSMMTLVATYLNLGPRSDFVLQWGKAYIVAWPVAACTAYLVMPMARRFTRQLVSRIDGTP